MDYMGGPDIIIWTLKCGKISQRDVMEEEVREIQSVRRTQPANAGFVENERHHEPRNA